MFRLVVVASLVAACGGSDENLPTGPITAQVTHYDLAFDVDTRVAHATVTATVTTGGDCITLPFRGQAVTAVKLDGKDADDVTLTPFTACGRGWNEGDTLTLETDHTIALDTLADSQVGYSTNQDSDHNPYDYLLSWVGECDRFLPCDNRADQFATYTFHVTHPAELTVRCPGVVTDDSATETTCDFQYEGGPTYSTFGVIASSAWTAMDMGTWAGVHVTVYDRASTGTAAAIDPAYHTGFLMWMQSQFGPWPYGSELRVLTAPTYWDGFEHPGNIVLADSMAHQTRPAYKHPVAHVLDHEMTHQWAGDQTTLADTYDFVWKESMAEYLAYVYEDMADPTAAPQTATYWKNASSVANYFPVPGEKPALYDYYGDAYGPGPMVLFRQLEVLTSRDQVLAALKTVLGHPHALSVDELVAALSQSTGLDLTAYSAAWIHGTGRPQWPTVAVQYNAGTLTVHQATAPERRCKFHVALDGDNPGEVALVEVDTFRNGTDQTIPVTPPTFTVTRTVIDPLAECLVYGASFVRPARFNPWVTH